MATLKIFLIRTLNKMIKYTAVFAIAALAVACGRDKPTISYNKPIDTTSVAADLPGDTTKIIVAELPVKFDSTDVLLFAVGLVDLQERGGYSKMSSGSYSSSDVSSGYFNSDDFTGNFVNIVFQDKDGKETKLTEDKIKIRSVNFLREVFNKTKTGYLLYSVYDRDSNGDKELSYMDVEALYISKADGSDFKKLTRELHEFYDWNWIKDKNRIYFRTLEDKNKDGELNHRDEFHYYFIDFRANTYSVSEYNPVRIFEKR